MRGNLALRPATTRGAGDPLRGEEFGRRHRSDTTRASRQGIRQIISADRVNQYIYRAESLGDAKEAGRTRAEWFLHAY